MPIFAMSMFWGDRIGMSIKKSGIKGTTPSATDILFNFCGNRSVVKSKQNWALDGLRDWPGGEHDGFAFVGEALPEFFGDKGHEGVKEF